MKTKTLLDLSREKTTSDCVRKLYDHYAVRGSYPDMLKLPEDVMKELASACSYPAILMTRGFDVLDPAIAEEGYAQWGMFKGIPVVI